MPPEYPPNSTILPIAVTSSSEVHEHGEDISRSATSVPSPPIGATELATTSTSQPHHHQHRQCSASIARNNQESHNRHGSSNSTPLDVMQASFSHLELNAAANNNDNVGNAYHSVTGTENNNNHHRSTLLTQSAPNLPAPKSFLQGSCCSIIHAARRSSSSTDSKTRASLYPSLEDVTRSTSEFDSYQVEQNWQKAAAAATLRTSGNQKKTTSSTASSTQNKGASPDGILPTQTATTTSATAAAAAATITTTPRNTRRMAAVVASYVQRSLSLGSTSNASNREPHNTTSRGLDGTTSATSTEFITGEANTVTDLWTPPLGSPDDAVPDSVATTATSYGSAASYGGQSYGNDNTNIRSVEKDYDDDDDMIALKMAAYMGGNIAVAHTCVVPETATVAEEVPAATEATIVEFGTIHQQEDESVVQAEFLCQSDYAQQQQQHRHGDYAGYDAFPQPSRVQDESRLQSHSHLHHTGNDPGVATEATVIASGPPDKATEQAWSAADAIEATVLLEGSVREISYGSIDDLDTKPPAIPFLSQGDVGVVPLGGASDNGLSAPNSSMNLEQIARDIELDAINSAAVATVVDYDVHPAEMANGSVEAQFLGTSHLQMGGEMNNQSSGRSSTTLGENELIAETVEGEATEATVVDSGPIEKATAEAWSSSVAEEAVVLEETQVQVGDSIHGFSNAVVEAVAAVQAEQAGEDRLPIPNATNDSAEIVAISEEVHPSELISESAVTAEFVAQNAEYISNQVPLPNNSIQHVDMAGNVTNASVADAGNSLLSTAESTHFEAEATLVTLENSETTGVDGHEILIAHDDLPAATQQLGATQALEAQPIELVTVLEVSDNPGASITDDDFYDYPRKPIRSCDRIQSEPVRSNESYDDIHRNTRSSDGDLPREEWTRVPSFGGNSESDVPPPIIPPPEASVRVVDSLGSIESAPPVLERQTAALHSANSLHDENTADYNGVNSFTNNLARGTNNVMEILFGNTLPGMVRKPISFEMDSLTASVLPRALLPSSVIFSEATNSWVATVNTSQKALEGNNVEESSKALRAFSVPTKKQAICLARAWAPPRMHPFSSNPNCFLCETQFAVFRRACHCRNCGVCVCSSCSMQWPSKMLPATYNIKREGTVNICKACDWLCTSFRLALLNGEYDKAIALYETGNINLTTPFANVKGELFYPVHCAVLGGNLNLLQWLVDEHCCPLRSIRVSSGKQKDSSSGSYTPILTSKGRSLLNIALTAKNIGIVRYLVVDKRMLLWAEKDLSMETLVQNLDLVLRILPEEALAGQQTYEQPEHRRTQSGSEAYNEEAMDGIVHTMPPPMVASEEAEANEHGAIEPHDDCIICFSNPIDCVVTPCGHQICCLECGNNISRCPVCSVECSFIRVFRA